MKPTKEEPFVFTCPSCKCEFRTEYSYKKYCSMTCLGRARKLRKKTKDPEGYKKKRREEERSRRERRTAEGSLSQKGSSYARSLLRSSGNRLLSVLYRYDAHAELRLAVMLGVVSKDPPKRNQAICAMCTKPFFREAKGRRDGKGKKRLAKYCGECRNIAVRDYRKVTNRECARKVARRNRWKSQIETPNKDNEEALLQHLEANK